MLRDYADTAGVGLRRRRLLRGRSTGSQASR